MSSINVIGLGYIGLPTSLMFAANGNHVVGTDNNNEIIEILKSGKLTFSEKGLDGLFESAIKNISFTNQCITTDKYIIAVPTPYIKENKCVEASYIIEAVKQVLLVCEHEAVIIIESTVSPGTIDKYVRPLVTEMGTIVNKTIHLVHAPERILPGNMIHELKNNARIIGADSIEIAKKIGQLYSTFCNGEIEYTSIKIAEMCKVVENTYRDINIAFANELAQICYQSGIDVHEVIKIANMHPRVNILNPGPGVGGHCISVDPWFLVGDYPDLTQLILAARRKNDNMPRFILSRIEEIMKENGMESFSGVGLYGITYKEDVDDIRESPTLQLIEIMEHKGINGVAVYDPMLKTSCIQNQYTDFDEFIEDIKILVVLVGHKHIKNNINRIRDKIIFDTRNVIEIEGTYKL